MLELEHAAESGVPATVRAAPIEQDEAVVVVGSPAGLPIKVDAGGRVIDARTKQGDYFTLSSDTFAVSSGSGVFDAKGQLVGLFARGRRDYDTERDCQRAHHHDPQQDDGYEEATPVAPLAALLDEELHEAGPPEPDGATCQASAFVQPVVTASNAAHGCGVLQPAATSRASFVPWSVAFMAYAHRRRKRRSDTRRGETWQRSWRARAWLP